MQCSACKYCSACVYTASDSPLWSGRCQMPRSLQLNEPAGLLLKDTGPATHSGLCRSVWVCIRNSLHIYYTLPVSACLAFPCDQIGVEIGSAQGQFRQRSTGMRLLSHPKVVWSCQQRHAAITIAPAVHCMDLDCQQQLYVSRPVPYVVRPVFCMADTAGTI